MRRIFLFQYLLLGLFCFTNGVAAETTYITDKIAVELFSSTYQRGVLVTSVKSGASVEVIQTDGDYAKVRTQDAQEGWLHKKYLSTDQPTQVSYRQLMAKHQQLQKELGQLRVKLNNSAKADKDSAAMGKIRNELNHANKTISGLKKQLDEKTAALEQNHQQIAELEKQYQASQKALLAKSQTPPAPVAEPKPQPPVAEPQPLAVASTPVKTELNLDYPIALKWLLGAMLLGTLLGSYLGYSWLDSKIARRHGGVRIR